MGARERFCTLVIVATLSNIASGWDYFEADLYPAGLKRIRMIRATIDSVVAEVNCGFHCTGNVTWEYKTNRVEEWATLPPSNVQRVHNMYRIGGLHPAQMVYLRGTMQGSSSVLVGYTCMGNPQDVQDLRVGKNGPGWLDIRWSPSRRDFCRSDFEYQIRHRVENGSFTPYRSFGFYPIDNEGHLHIGPSHPCPTWPREFCLLLTENVIAGKNHIVEIIVKRLNGSSTEVSRGKTIVAYADPLNAQGNEEIGMNPECHPWAYLAIFASLFSIAIIVTMLVSSVVYAVRKANEYERVHGPPTEPFDFMEMLYNT